MLPIGERIRNLRRAKNETQEELSALLGVSFQAVSRWENGDAYPDIELLPKIAAHFDVTTDVLLGADKETVEAERNRRCAEERERIQKIWLGDKDHLTAYRESMAAFGKYTEEFWFAYCAANCLTTDILPREEALPVFRELTDKMLKQPVPVWRFFALRLVYLFEDENRLEEYWKYVPPFPITRNGLLAERYSFRGETEKHRRKRKENLYETLCRAFEVEFRDDTPEGAAASAQAALKIIDCLRDPSDDRDAWLGERIRQYRTLADAFDLLGERESCYRALDRAVTLCEFCFTVPEDEPLAFHSPVLDPLTVSRRYNFKPELGAPPSGELLRSNLQWPLFDLLTSPFDNKPGYWDDPFYRSVTDRIGVMHDREFR